MSSEFLTSESEIRDFLSKFNISNFTVNGDGSVDVQGSIYLDNLKAKQLPVQFGKVDGDFVCNGGELVTLKGSPRYVNGNYYVHHNRLKDFQYSPEEVTGNVSYDNNEEVTSIEGIVPKIGGDLFMENLPKLENLHNIHKHVTALGYGLFGSGHIKTDGTPLKSNVLGLLLIKGLDEVTLANKELSKLINKYLKSEEKDLHMCQEELIESGFGMEAKL